MTYFLERQGKNAIGSPFIFGHNCIIGGSAFYSGAPGTFDQSLCFAPKEISLLEMTQPLDPLIFLFSYRDITAKIGKDENFGNVLLFTSFLPFSRKLSSVLSMSLAKNKREKK